MNDKLKPCPFCGRTDVVIVKTVNDTDEHDISYSVLCQCCYTTGPLMRSRREAAEEWNRRAEVKNA